MRGDHEPGTSSERFTSRRMLHQELKRESRRRGRAFIAKRASSKRRAERLRLVEELGVDVVRQMTLDQKRKKEGKCVPPQYDSEMWWRVGLYEKVIVR